MNPEEPQKESELITKNHGIPVTPYSSSARRKPTEGGKKVGPFDDYDQKPDKPLTKEEERELIKKAKLENKARLEQRKKEIEEKKKIKEEKRRQREERKKL